jgi:N-hydroxyarylamine O-acetyltransferase
MTQQEKISAYLNRIGFNETPKLDYDTLHRLQRLHLQSVPYENLDIMREIPLSLDPQDIFDKIVIRGRGGYCFELNGLFTWLLRTLGFPVTEFMSRFLRDEKEIPMRRHRVLKVSCGGKDYLSDVGVGSMVPRKPLELVCGQISVQGNEKYKLEREGFFGYILYEWRKEAWSRVYSFTEEEQLNLDYIMPSFYCEKHPDSIFNKRNMVAILTGDGRRTLDGNVFKKFVYGKDVTTTVPRSDAEFKSLLYEYFGLSV